MSMLLTLELRFEQDVVLTRQRTRQIAELLGFDSQDQTRIATAVSEISRNAFQYTGGGKVVFSLEEEGQGIMRSLATLASPSIAQVLLIKISDTGPGIANLAEILAGHYTSNTSRGLGIIGTKRLMDYFEIESNPQTGTIIWMGKNLPKRLPLVTNQRFGQIVDELIRRSPTNPFEEIQWQNQELLRALEALRQREEELTLLNQELEDTNRGVVSLYAELDEKADSLQRANELKTRFLSNMSHEFRTPLNSIISLSGLLLNRIDGELTSEQEKQVTFMRKAAEGLSELVNDLLDLAKVEAGKIVVHPAAFEVSELFGTLRGMLRPLLAYNSSIALIFEEPANIPTLYTDEGKVAQILRNFISNALKYTELGEVRVSVTLIDSNQITFAVKDTGIGIAPENQEKIFEEYIQIQSPLQKLKPGTGLGLPLARKLAELLGGRVWLESTLGSGATFYASIPLVCPNFTPEGLPATTWQLDPNRLAVLVVEDSAETLLTYEKYLQGTRYQIIHVSTLNQAENAIANFQPEAIILDILLKQENTWGFLAQLKETQTTQNVPILVTTVINNEHKALGLGANAFLIKPIDRFLLLNTLNKLVMGDRRQTLLLVDDDPVDRYLFKALLTDSLRIIEADKGSDGMKLAQMEQPDCIVLDLCLHNESGIDILNSFKSDPTTINIPVIIQTSQVLGVEHQQLVEQTVAIVSKERPNRDVAKILLQEALVKAGLFFATLGKDHA
jgi:signal transduction histidine kinase/CheY-like chemotaxis protein